MKGQPASSESLDLAQLLAEARAARDKASLLISTVDASCEVAIAKARAMHKAVETLQREIELHVGQLEERGFTHWPLR